MENSTNQNRQTSDDSVNSKGRKSSFKDLAFQKLQGKFLDNIEENAPRKSRSDKRLELIQALALIDLDPNLYDSLSGNELDRNLKRKFGITFLVFTAFFTIASYAIILLNAIFNWKISDIAISALIIETPIQFIGILYIVAKNLFPGEKSNGPKVKINLKEPSA